MRRWEVGLGWGQVDGERDRKAGGPGVAPRREKKKISNVSFLSNPCHLLQPGGPPPLGWLGERLSWISQAPPGMPGLPLGGSHAVH